MKTYDFDKAKALIEENRFRLKSASLGIHEDWFWTADTIWEDGEYLRIILSNKDAKKMFVEYMQRRKDGMSVLDNECDNYKDCLVGGINGSSWATPSIQLEFTDGSERMIPCYNGESDGERNPLAGMLGCLSGPAQERITPLESE